MKQIIFPLTFSFLLLLFITSCKNDETKETPSPTLKDTARNGADTLKQPSFIEVFNRDKSLAQTAFAREVSYADADLCVQNYKTIMTGTNCKPIKDSYIESISFWGDELTAWMQKTVQETGCTHFRIVLAIYTKEFETKYGLANKAGKLTAFLWPYNGNTRSRTPATPTAAEDFAKPFNLGELHP